MKGFFSQKAMLIAECVHQCVCRCDDRYHPAVIFDEVIDDVTFVEDDNLVG
jgi:hypothetical protein